MKVKVVVIYWVSTCESDCYWLSFHLWKWKWLLLTEFPLVKIKLFLAWARQLEHRCCSRREQECQREVCLLTKVKDCGSWIKLAGKNKTAREQVFLLTQVNNILKLKENPPEPGRKQLRTKQTAALLRKGVHLTSGSQKLFKDCVFLPVTKDRDSSPHQTGVHLNRW